MTKVQNGLKLNFKQENTTIEQYRVVKLGTGADEVVAAVDGASPIIGISNESADSTTGNPVGVIVDGTAKLTILAATTKGAYIKGTTAWKGASTTVDTENFVWILLETTTVANQVAEVAIRPGTFAG